MKEEELLDHAKPRRWREALPPLVALNEEASPFRRDEREDHNENVSSYSRFEIINLNSALCFV
jgi:hypothetical protein